jgi:hypothetical protein
VKAADFESAASTNFATRAKTYYIKELYIYYTSRFESAASTNPACRQAGWPPGLNAINKNQANPLAALGLQY